MTWISPSEPMIMSLKSRWLLNVVLRKDTSRQFSCLAALPAIGTHYGGSLDISKESLNTKPLDRVRNSSFHNTLPPYLKRTTTS